jgi:cytochrome c peroxidase
MSALLNRHKYYEYVQQLGGLILGRVRQQQNIAMLNVRGSIMYSEYRQSKVMTQLKISSLVLLLIVPVIGISSAFAKGGVKSVDSASTQSQTVVAQSNSGGGGGSGGGSGGTGGGGMVSLKSVPVPTVPDLNNFIRDKTAAIKLGKALFWDSQVGSDGNACASCHFHAGADNRLTNSLAPDLRGGDTTFFATATGSGGPNATLKAQDFPFHRLSNPADRNSAIVFDTNNIASSQGSFGGAFMALAANGKEICGARPQEDGFNVKGVITRHVPPRNTPSAINAVFNYRNFWDGRANNGFNGVNPFGPRDPDAKVLQKQADGSMVWVKINLRNASLASQAVGPALSDFEMSCANRTFKDLGRKMLSVKPLGTQKVAATDSVLGAIANTSGNGLNTNYDALIEAAIDPKWWSASDKVDGYSQKEQNFSLYWGLAIMMYESTLISDETPFDKYAGDATHAPNRAALTKNQLNGFNVMAGKGQCMDCHKGSEFTDAASGLQTGALVDNTQLKGANAIGVQDVGFHNIGVRPSSEDVGVGGKDPFGNPLSFARTWFSQLLGNVVPDPVTVSTILAPDPNSARVVVDGAVKTPSLRNVALTQPYFHNGSRFTLEQVVEFYSRGGDRRGPDGNDTTALVTAGATNGGTTNAASKVKSLGLSAKDMADVVDFLRYGLTDQRVVCEQAPFDHPSLTLHNGHVGNEVAVTDTVTKGIADDYLLELPAVGSEGLPKSNCAVNDIGVSAVR